MSALRTAMLAIGLTALAPASIAAQSHMDSVLVARVEAAIEASTDLPTDSLEVSAEGGVVRVSGSLLCEDCGGNRTPGGTGAIQQGLGALVRAVPGVDRVVFDLVYRRPQVP